MNDFLVTQLAREHMSRLLAKADAARLRTAAENRASERPRWPRRRP